jgi:hypothetical protein
MLIELLVALGFFDGGGGAAPAILRPIRVTPTFTTGPAITPTFTTGPTITPAWGADA